MQFQVWGIIFKILHCQRILENYLLSIKVHISPAGDLASSCNNYRHIWCLR